MFTQNQSFKLIKHSFSLKKYLGWGKKWFYSDFLSQNEVYANEVILQKCCIIMMPGKQQIFMTQIFLSCFGLYMSLGNSWLVSWFLIVLQVKLMTFWSWAIFRVFGRVEIWVNLVPWLSLPNYYILQSHKPYKSRFLVQTSYTNFYAVCFLYLL